MIRKRSLYIRTFKDNDFHTFYAGRNKVPSILNSINFLGNGGLFENNLNTVKRLITSRPTLKQYIIKRREDNYYSTVRPQYVGNTTTSPCANSSTSCILHYLRSRGLIRASAKNHPSMQLKTINSKYPGYGRTIPNGRQRAHDYTQLPRGRGRYRPDCWSSDGENAQAPPINYSDYTDVGASKIKASSKNRPHAKFRRARRRNSAAISDPCLWQEDFEKL